MPLTAFFCYFSGLFPKIPKTQKKKEGLKMNYRKTFSRITLIAWSTIAVILVMWSIVLHPAEADSLFYPAVNYDTGDEPYSVAIGDLNGDGDPDLAVANGESDNVSVLLGNGDGSFQSAVNYGAGDGPYSVAIGDLNGDGDPDKSLLLNLQNTCDIHLISVKLPKLRYSQYTCNRLILGFMARHLKK
jgi:hypothetical protein